MLYSLSAALTTHPSYLHFRRGENTDNPPSLTREGLDASASSALFADRNVHQTHKLHPILSLENIILLDISVIRV
jgi:hypothetical protein